MEDGTGKRRLAVLTSGGDCAGMNAVVSAVVKMAMYHGFEAYIVREGYEGLVRGNADARAAPPATEDRHFNSVPLTCGYGEQLRHGSLIPKADGQLQPYIIKVGWDDVRGWTSIGGTLIGTARCKEFRERSGRAKAVYNMICNKIDYLVVCGGDGSLTGADTLRAEWPGLLQELHADGKISAAQLNRFHHLRIVGLVGSIDNDMATTDLTIGASTALLRICEALDSISSTASSHSRAFVVEVMGRHCGWLAMMAGIAAGADYVYLPEHPPSPQWRKELCDVLLQSRSTGKRKSIVIVAEGANDAELNPIRSTEIAEVLTNELHLDTRVTTLGHTQRGGAPDARDRVLATLQSIEALKVLLEDAPGKPSYIVGTRGNRLERIPLRHAIEVNNTLAQAMKERRFGDALRLRGEEFNDRLAAFLATTHMGMVEARPLPQRTHRMAIMHVGAPAGGMNTAARAAVRYCLAHGHTPVLVQNGFSGLLEDSVSVPQWMRVDSWATSGGSELGTNRHMPNIDLEGVANKLRQHDIHSMLIVGGFEALRSVKIMKDAREQYSAFRIPIISLPATLSNNIPLNDYSIGCNTSLNVLVTSCDAIIQSASASRNRTFVVEVQGGQCGFLAVLGALATNGIIAYTPEEGVSLDRLAKDIAMLRKRFELDPHGMSEGRLIICNEKASAVYRAQRIADMISTASHGLFDSRYERLSHTLQGKTPAPQDRVQALQVAVKACHILEEAARSDIHQLGDNAPTDAIASLITVRGGQLVPTPIEKVSEYADFNLRRGTTAWWEPCRQYVNILGGKELVMGPSNQA